MSGGAIFGEQTARVAVGLWCIELAPDPDGADLALLSTAERARAARFVFDRDRDHFVAAHAALRRVLAGYAGSSAADLRIVKERRGRPRADGGSAFDFNLSHSGALALIGVASAGPIGVDIEASRPVIDSAALAERHFSRAEVAALAALPDALRNQGFLRCWTRKEACLKALGVGLTVPTDDIEVGIEASSRRVALKCGQQAVELTVTNYDVHRGAVAALATAGAPEVSVFVRRCSELR